MDAPQYPFDRVQVRAENPLPEISLVMPVFNEGDIVEPILRNWVECLNSMKVSFEILVINDGSLDGTGRVLDKLRREMPELRVIHQLNSGHGQAIYRGYLMARGDYILQCDLNGRYETEDFSRLWESKGIQRLLIAQRTHRLDSLSRRCVVHLLHLTCGWIFGVKLRDPNVPFRLFKRDPLVSFLKILPPGWKSPNLALSIYAAKETPQLVTEVKIPFRKRTLGPSSTSFYDLVNLGFEYLTELLTLRQVLKTAQHKISLLEPARKAG